MEPVSSSVKIHVAVLHPRVGRGAGLFVVGKVDESRLYEKHNGADKGVAAEGNEKNELHGLWMGKDII